MKLQDALKRAQALGLDLVEVAPNATPPVCRIVDFGKYRYELAKQEKDRKAHTTKLKEIKFRVNIDEHDYNTKLRHGEEFLVKGNKVRVQLQFRGRENAHKELGDVLMGRVREDLSGVGAVEMEPKHVGRSITMVISPLPASKRKRKFAPPVEPMIDEEPDIDDGTGGDDEAVARGAQNTNPSENAGTVAEADRGRKIEKRDSPGQ